ncbi:leucine-rich repeat domain-containing protein [Simkania sp.]|uniref:leucine-rich repeat domain-containing protein n=1 Tax=Simkania sp. TaxID=34094 RepID=UPI003B5188F1
MDLSDNQLTELPAEMCNCKRLETLHVRNKPLKTLPHAVEKLKRLSDVNLRGVPLEKLPVEIAGLSYLEVFVLETASRFVHYEEGRCQTQRRSMLRS